MNIGDKRRDPLNSEARARPTGGFRMDIQGLRGIAILAVVAYHVGIDGFHGGFVGVDVFFVLSGYLITGLLVSEFKRTGRIQLLAFTARRVRRLLPASALVLMVTLIAATLVYSPLQLVDIGRTAQTVAVYAGNLFFAIRATDYLAGDTSTNPFLQTWSLAVEEQFYLIWPMTVGLLMWFGRKWWRPKRAVALGMFVVSVGTFALTMILMTTRQNWAFFASPPRFWEFAVGGIATILPAERIRNRAAITTMGFGGLALIFLSIFLYDATTTFPGFTALPPVLGTALVLVAGAAGRSSTASTVLSWKPLGWFGQYSYSWYLWHWPMLVIPLIIWPTMSTLDRSFAAVIALACSVASFHLVERRVRYSTWLSSRTGVTILGGLLLTLACLGVATAVIRHADIKSASPDQRAFAAASADRPNRMGPQCWTRYLETEPKDLCEWGDVDSRKTIVLMGDSHAGAWAPAVDELAKKHRYRLVPMFKSSCPYPSVEPFNARLGRKYLECSTWRDRSMERIRSIKPDLVILSSESDYVAKPGEVDISGISREQWRSGIRKTIRELAEDRIRVVVIADIPMPNFDVPACLSRAAGALIGAPDCTFDRNFSRSLPASEIEREVVPAMGIDLLDFTDTICPQVKCRPWRGGNVLYSDANHMTASFNRTLAPTLETLLSLHG